MSLSILLMVVGSCFIFFCVSNAFIVYRFFCFRSSIFLASEVYRKGFSCFYSAFSQFRFFFTFFVAQFCLIVLRLLLLCALQDKCTQLASRRNEQQKQNRRKKIKDLITFSFNSTLKALSSFFNTPFCCCAPSLRGFFFSHQSLISFTKFFLIAL